MNDRRKTSHKLAGLCALLLLLSLLMASVPATNAAPVQAENTQTPAPEPPYKGDGSKYTYIMADERDRQWEEDIVFFANAFLDFLHGHPKLSGRSVVTYERNYSSGRLLIQNSSEYTSFYDEALRNTFLEEVNLLILSIPTRSDKEIIISLQKIAALLHDAHTVVVGAAACCSGAGVSSTGRRHAESEDKAKHSARRSKRMRERPL